MDIYNSHADSKSGKVKKTRNLKFIVAGISVVAALGLAFPIFFYKSTDRKAGTARINGREYIAELISATGTVYIGKSGGTEWDPVLVGARFVKGDLVQTDDFSEATLRYDTGATVSIQASTIITVCETADGSMEISVPFRDADLPDTDSGTQPESSDQSTAKSGENAGTGDKAKLEKSNPFIKIDRIIPFGRSLELVGTVEPGSRLTVNNESVEVAGDGTFKHFTNPFTAKARKVRILLKVKNLAGLTRTITTVHDFDPLGRED